MLHYFHPSTDNLVSTKTQVWVCVQCNKSNKTPKAAQILERIPLSKYLKVQTPKFVKNPWISFWVMSKFENQTKDAESRWGYNVIQFILGLQPRHMPNQKKKKKRRKKNLCPAQINGKRWISMLFMMRPQRAFAFTSWTKSCSCSDLHCNVLEYSLFKCFHLVPHSALPSCTDNLLQLNLTLKQQQTSLPSEISATKSYQIGVWSLICLSSVRGSCSDSIANQI